MPSVYEPVPFPGPINVGDRFRIKASEHLTAGVVMIHPAPAGYVHLRYEDREWLYSAGEEHFRTLIEERIGEPQWTGDGSKGPPNAHSIERDWSAARATMIADLVEGETDGPGRETVEAPLKTFGIRVLFNVEASDSEGARAIASEIVLGLQRAGVEAMALEVAGRPVDPAQALKPPPSPGERVPTPDIPPETLRDWRGLLEDVLWWFRGNAASAGRRARSTYPDLERLRQFREDLQRLEDGGPIRRTF